MWFVLLLYQMLGISVSCALWRFWLHIPRDTKVWNVIHRITCLIYQLVLNHLSTNTIHTHTHTHPQRRVRFRKIHFSGSALNCLIQTSTTFFLPTSLSLSLPFSTNHNFCQCVTITVIESYANKKKKFLWRWWRTSALAVIFIYNARELVSIFSFFEQTITKHYDCDFYRHSGHK